MAKSHKKKSKGKFLEKMNKLGKSIKKILIVSGGRADYDLLKPVILKLKKGQKFKYKNWNNRISSF